MAGQTFPSYWYPWIIWNAFSAPHSGTVAATASRRMAGGVVGSPEEKSRGRCGTLPATAWVWGDCEAAFFSAGIIWNGAVMSNLSKSVSASCRNSLQLRCPPGANSKDIAALCRNVLQFDFPPGRTVHLPVKLGGFKARFGRGFNARAVNIGCPRSSGIVHAVSISVNVCSSYWKGCHLPDFQRWPVWNT